MRVVIIGSGNVASVLGRLIQKNDHEIVQVISRNADHAKLLAQELQCPFSDNNNTVDMSAGLYLVAVNDGALYELNKTFHIHPESKGVGLYITKTQVEALGGQISVESEVNKGTTFKIVFTKID